MFNLGIANGAKIGLLKLRLMYNLIHLSRPYWQLNKKFPNEIHTVLYVGVPVRARMDEMERMVVMEEMVRTSLP